MKNTAAAIVIHSCSHEGAHGPCLPRVADGRCVWCQRELPRGYYTALRAHESAQVAK